MKKLLILALVLLQTVVLKAQYVVTAEGDSIDMNQNFLLEEEKPYFVQGNGLVLTQKVTPEKLQELEDSLYTSRKMRFAEYVTLAMLYDGYDGKWPLAYRCAVTANLHGAALKLLSNDSTLADTMKEALRVINIIENRHFFEHIEDDYDVLCAQLDSVLSSFKRLDAFDNIYDIQALNFDGVVYSQALASDVAKNIDVFKHRNNNISPQMKAIRLFLKVCNENAKSKTALAKAARPTISQSLSYDLTSRVNEVLVPDYWIGWSADDKVHTYLERVDEFTYKVTLLPVDLGLDARSEDSIKRKTFILKVSLPTDSKTWRVNEIIPIPTK